MTDERREVPLGTGGPGKSRAPKTAGKMPRVSVSLPEGLNEIIEKEAKSRGITISKYIADSLAHTHDENGINISEPTPGQVDLSPVLNAIYTGFNALSDRIGDIEKAVYALPSGSAAQRGTIQKALLPGPEEEPEEKEPASDIVPDSAAPEEEDIPLLTVSADHSAAPKSGEAWIKGGALKAMFNTKYIEPGYTFSRLLKKHRENGELIGREPVKKQWEYEPGSVEAFFKSHPEYKRG